MLIVFDLDDTLVSTSKDLQPQKIKQVAAVLQEAGLPLVDFEASCDQLLEQRKNYESFSEALKVFLQSFELSSAELETFCNIATNDYYKNFSTDFQLNPLPGAIELLDSLKNNFSLSVVTHGMHEYQMVKMKKAGIDSNRFSKIHITPTGEKKPLYAALIKEHHLRPDQVIVCGDKIVGDLLPAKELGFWTIHVRTVKKQKHNGWPCDYSVQALSEIEQIAKNINELQRVKD